MVWFLLQTIVRVALLTLSQVKFPFLHVHNKSSSVYRATGREQVVLHFTFCWTDMIQIPSPAPVNP